MGFEISVEFKEKGCVGCVPEVGNCGTCKRAVEGCRWCVKPTARTVKGLWSG
jgi:hypothetical protein